jgi:hypothetical protein
MIPLGLKETKEVDFFEQFSDFILEHYSVDPSNFEDAILDLIDTRQVQVGSQLFDNCDSITILLFFIGSENANTRQSWRGIVMQILQSSLLRRTTILSRRSQHWTVFRVV